MTAVVVGLILVPLLDQAVKLLVLRRLGPGSIPLGPVGQLRVVQTRIWIVRAPTSLSMAALWVLWVAAAAALAIVCRLVPSLGWPAGLLLGGALSHTIETSLRGWVCDYVCLRFWPAFNVADVALTAGAGGMVVELSAAIQTVWA